MLLAIILLFVGLGLLVLCSDRLVLAATHLAKHLGISEFLIGMTVVAIGTGTPELVTSAVASAQGHGIIALGNVIGSNLANIGIVLALAGMSGAVRLKTTQSHLKEAAIVFFLTILLFVLAADRTLNMTDAWILLGLFFVYMLWLGSSVEEQTEEDTLLKEHKHKHPTFHVFSIFLAATGLWVGARFVVEGAITIARELHIGEGIIAMTVIAIGTSLPELSVALQAARKKQIQLLLGDILGANTLNILLVLGVGAFIHPIPVSGAMLSMIPVAAALAGVVWIILRTSKRISPAESALLLLSYVMATVILALTS